MPSNDTSTAYTIHYAENLGSSHYRDFDGYCAACGESWPCDVTRALDDIATLRAEVARLTAYNPYPVDIWTELTTEEEGAINAALDLSGVPYARDRVYASWGRRVLAALRTSAGGDDA